jgi:alpha-ketoglutarate-dependent taurine dioxygenase
MDIRPVDATLGAEVHCVDLSAPLSDSDFAEIEAAWNQHAVLIFPGQMLSDDQHLAFTRRFGRLEQSIRRGSTTNLSRLSNLDKEGKVVPRTSIQARFLDGNT